MISIKDLKYNESSPILDLLIIEGNLDLPWYTLDGGKTNKYFSGSSVQIDQDLWDYLPDGSINITIYAEDLIGNLRSCQTILTKAPTSEGNNEAEQLAQQVAQLQVIILLMTISLIALIIALDIALFTNIRRSKAGKKRIISTSK